MAGQTTDDGIRWGFQLFSPSIVSIVLIHLTESLYGGIWAGFVSILLTIVMFGGVALSAKYWHIPSTIGFLMAGLLLWYFLPDVTAEMVPWPFTLLQNLIIAGFFVLVVFFLLNKVGFEP